MSFLDRRRAAVEDLLADVPDEVRPMTPRHLEVVPRPAQRAVPKLKKSTRARGVPRRHRRAQDLGLAPHPGRGRERHRALRVLRPGRQARLCHRPRLAVPSAWHPRGCHAEDPPAPLLGKRRLDRGLCPPLPRRGRLRKHQELQDRERPTRLDPCRRPREDRPHGLIAQAAANLRCLRAWAARTGDRTDPLTHLDPEDYGFEEIDPAAAPPASTGPPLAA